MTLHDRYSNNDDFFHEKRPRIIQSDAENQAALKEIGLLLAKYEALDPADEAYLALLTLVVERFEEEAQRLRTALPTDVLRRMIATGVKSATAIPYAGIRKINAVQPSEKHRCSRLAPSRLWDR